VLAYARLEEGRGAARIERVALRDLIARHRPALERRVGDAGLVLDVADVADDLQVETDVDAVGQVLFNLVDNACKYARGSQPARLELAVRTDGDEVVVRLRDHGPGIAAELARRIFAPFDRGSRDGDAMPGVGLGLALARGIAKDLRGALVLVDPAELAGPGAAFDLRLPRVR